MTTLLAFSLLLTGFVALYYGAEWLVEGAVALATHFNISRVVAGVVLVAFGTSAPELFVNSIAAVRGETGFALSNVSGSNLANLLVGFGLCAIFVQLPVSIKQFRIDLLFFALAPLGIFLIMLSTDSAVPIWALGPLLLAFAAYMYISYSRMHDVDGHEEDEDEMTVAAALVRFLIGIGLLYFGGEMTVRQALTIGRVLNMSEAILGLTVVALGTSIPDITASVVAARAGESEIAAGNLIGSNVFNILFVIPITLMFAYLSGTSALVADQQVALTYGFVTMISFLFFLFVSRSSRLSRLTGYGMVVLYIIYMLFRVLQ